MRRSPQRALAALLFALLAVAPAPAAEAAEHRLTGQVVAADGTSVAGARVELRPLASGYDEALGDLDGRFRPPPVDRAVAADDGRFTLRAPGEGLWELAAAAPGKLPSRLLVGPLHAAEELAPLSLVDGEEIEVRVVDAAGAPVAGALVTAEGLGGAPLRWRTTLYPEAERRRATTREDGRARLWRRDGEKVRLVAAAAGHAPAAADSEGEAVTLHLAAGRPLAVTVKTPDGRPAAGAVVAGLPHGGGGEAVPLGVSGDDGRLEVRIVDADGLRLVAFTAAGHRATLALPPLDAETATGGDETPRTAALELAAPPSLTGRTLAEPDRAPVAGAWVWASDAPYAAVRSDAHGGFTLPLVGEASSQVVADAAGHSAASERLDAAAPASASPLTLLLAATTALAGRVVDANGEAVAGARIVAQPLVTGARRFRPRFAGGALVRRAGSGAGGAFRVDGLVPGEAYTLDVAADGFAPARREVGGLEQGVVREGVEIVLTPGILAFGHLVGDGETPVAGAEVVLSPVADTASMRRWMSLLSGPEAGLGATSDGDGRFEFHDLGPGRFDLALSATGFAPLQVPGLELPAGEAEVDLGTVLLAPGAAIEGRVTDAERRPIAGAQVTWNGRRSGIGAFFASRFGDRTPTVTSGADGRFRIEDLAAGEPVDLGVKAAGYAHQTVPAVRAPSEEPVVVVLEPASSIAGVVVDESGSAVAGASVLSRGELGRRMGGFQNTVSDEDGAFVLDEVASGKVTLTVRAKGFQGFEKELGELAAGEQRRDVRLRLTRGATVTGRVTGGDGQPLREARVQVQATGDRRFGFTAGGGAAVTDAAGEYVLDGVPIERLSIAAEHDAHLRSVRDLEVALGDNRLDFRLEHGLTVAGRVVDDGGSPVLGAEVRLGGAPRAWFAGGAETSDEEGRFELRGVEPGTHTLTAVKEGYAPAVEEGLQVTAPVAGLELVLGRGARVFGRLLGVDFETVSRLLVMATSTGRASLSAIGSVDFEGGYRIEGLAPGAWTIVAVTEQGRQVAEQVTIEPGEREVQLDLDLGDGGGYTLSGVVTVAGRPLAGALVTAVGRQRASNAMETSDRNGRFRLAGLEPGTYTLSVNDGNAHSQVYRRDLEIDGDREVTIAIETTEIAGQVIDRASGAPLAGVEVRLQPADPDGVRPFGPRTTSDEAGRFRFTEVAGGDYRVRAERDGYSPAEAAVTLADGLAASGVELALEATRGLTLYVRSTLGALPATVQVAALPPGAPAPDAAPQPVLADRLATGEGGRVELGRLPAGSWRLLVAGDGLATVEVAATAPGPPLTVTLPPAGIVDVVLPALADTGRYGALRLLAADGSPWRGLDWIGRPRVEWELQSGRARVTGVPPGSWTVEVTTPDGERRTATVTTAPGTVSEVRFD